MTSNFNVNAASGYEQLMGGWSKKLAPLFIKFAGLDCAPAIASSR
jgi:hypothetical protein